MAAYGPGVKAFVKEALIWSTLSHANIMPLEGYVMVQNRPCLFSEWEDNGTINDFIKQKDDYDYVKLVSD